MPVELPLRTTNFSNIFGVNSLLCGWNIIPANENSLSTGAEEGRVVLNRTKKELDKWVLLKRKQVFSGVLQKMKGL